MAVWAIWELTTTLPTNTLPIKTGFFAKESLLFLGTADVAVNDFAMNVHDKYSPGLLQFVMSPLCLIEIYPMIQQLEA